MVIGTPGALILLLIAGMIFFVRIRQHTELRKAKSASLLRAALESTADGILVVDNKRHVTAYNQRFLEIWHIPPELAASGQDEEVLQCAADQAHNRREFLGKVQDLYSRPERLRSIHWVLKMAPTLNATPPRSGWAAGS